MVQVCSISNISSLEGGICQRVVFIKRNTEHFNVELFMNFLADVKPDT